uniref:ATP synthase mitochondrial F1 complex assembly factor 2 isoform X3 n=1 Tax=Myxine glutinosa TaxID=7769 RepID=UPI00358F38EF
MDSPHPKVLIHYSGKGYEVNVDRLKLRTPQGQVLCLPSEPLAIAVATEWDLQKDVIRLDTMHLSALCNTVQDNPSQRKSEQVIAAALRFFETDTICFRAEEPEALVTLQKEEWDPVVHWAQQSFEMSVAITRNLSAPPVAQDTRRILSQHLASYNSWALTGLEYVTLQLKSLLLCLATLDLQISVERAIFLSRLEEEFQQIAQWGRVEAAHEVEELELRARVAAGTLLARLASESTKKQHCSSREEQLHSSPTSFAS